MALIDDLPWSIMEYNLDTFEIVIGGSRHPLQKAQVKSIYIEKDFDDLMLPILMVSLAIPNDLYYNIQRNHKITTFTIVISSQKRGKDVGDTPTGKSIYLKDSFTPMGIDGTPFTNEEEYKKAKKEITDNDTLSMQDLQSTHTFVLARQKTIKQTRKIINKVMVSSNMSDAVGYLLTNSGCSNVLMSRMDNMTKYSELILLPVPLTEQLAYLNSMYGFYKQGAQIFFDFDTTYILRNCAKCTAYRGGEIQNVNFVVYKGSSGKSGDKGSCIYKKQGYINAGTSGAQFHIEDQSKSSNAYVGNNSLILNDDGSASEAITNIEDGYYNIITTTTHNQYYTSETALRLKELKGVVTMIAPNIDLKLLAPNKHYKILSDDSTVSKQVNAPFRLSKYSVIFGTEGDTFSPVATIVLKKTEV